MRRRGCILLFFGTLLFGVLAYLTLMQLFVSGPLISATADKYVIQADNPNQGVPYDGQPRPGDSRVYLITTCRYWIGFSIRTEHVVYFDRRDAKPSDCPKFIDGEF